MPLSIAAATLIGAGISALSGFMTNRKEISFAKEQSETQYQRAVADMMRAGLNPALAYSQGGNQAMGVSLENPGKGIDESIQSALRLQRVEVPKVEAETAKLNADAAYTATQDELLNHNFQSIKKKMVNDAHKAEADAAYAYERAQNEAYARREYLKALGRYTGAQAARESKLLEKHGVEMMPYEALKYFFDALGITPERAGRSLAGEPLEGIDLGEASQEDIDRARGKQKRR